jgi:hypothetical protein
MKKSLACALTFGLAAPAHAMDYSYRLYGSHSIVIDAVGRIEGNEAELLVTFIRSLPQSVQNRRVAGFVFNSPGGNVSGAFAIAKFIHDHKPNTGVAAGGACASACVIMWATGALKSAAPDSRIGVHNSSLDLSDTDDSESFDAENLSDALVAKYLAAWGAPADVVGHLMMTGPDDVYWLTPTDLNAWKVRITY